MIFWEKYYNDTALSSEQVGISGWMILVDLMGVALAFVGEVMFNRPDVAFPGWLPQVALMGTTAVVILNVAAFIGVSVFDPRRSMDRADRQSMIARLSAEVRLKTATAAQLVADSEQLAVEMAPGRSSHEIEALRRQYAVPALPAVLPLAPVVPAAPAVGAASESPFGAIQTPSAGAGGKSIRSAKA